MSAIEVTPAWGFGPVLSAFFAYGLAILVAVLAGVAMRRFVRNLREVREARRAAVQADGASLRPGFAVVMGTVETEPAGSSAVDVSIEQRGEERQGKKGWTHDWIEISRSVEARPFVLRVQSGERVRVCPGKDVFLVDALALGAMTASRTRTCQASLKAGERATVEGFLRLETVPGGEPSGYRDAGTAMVLRPRRGRRMLISTEPLDAGARTMARIHGIAAAVFLVLLLATQWHAFGPYYSLSWNGRPAVGSVLSKRTYTTRSGRGSSAHYEITVAAQTTEHGRVVFHDEVEREQWQAIEAGTRVPTLVSAKTPDIRQVGRRASANYAFVLTALLALAVAIVSLGVWRSQRTPWYLRKRLLHSGGGRLR